MFSIFLCIYNYLTIYSSIDLIVMGSFFYGVFNCPKLTLTFHRVFFKTTWVFFIYDTGPSKTNMKKIRSKRGGGESENSPDKKNIFISIDVSPAKTDWNWNILISFRNYLKFIPVYKIHKMMKMLIPTFILELNKFFSPRNMNIKLWSWEMNPEK